MYRVKKLVELWEEYTCYLAFLCRLFVYADRSYVGDNLKTQLAVLGVERFKDVILVKSRIDEM